MEPFGPTPEQVEACRRGRHHWLVVGRTTFHGVGSESLTCAHCPQNAYRIKELS